LCYDCRSVVTKKDKENNNSESSIFKSKPIKVYNCYNLTPENVMSDELIPQKNHKKFEVSKTKKTRKMDRDCIHKKIKARLFKFVKEALKKKLNPDLSALKIPQNIISDVTFNFNQKLLERNIQSIFSERYYYFNDPEKNINKIVRSEDMIDDLKLFLKKTVRECFEEYLEHPQFQTDIKKLKNDSYIDAFKSYSHGFIEYYKQAPNSKRSKKSSGTTQS